MPVRPPPLSNGIGVRSYLMLMVRLERFFSARGEPFCYVDPFNPDCLATMLKHQASGDRRVLNVVLVGGFLASVLEAPAWPPGRYRLWVLCERAKDVILEYTGFRPEQVGVIPRYKIFPPKKSPALFQANSSMTLIFAGRFTRTKGLFHLLEFVSALQIRERLPVRLVLSGEFSEIISAGSDLPAISDTTLKKRTLRLIKALPWIVEPEFARGLSPKEWPRIRYKNPVLISLSQFSHEDFGVSVAQAQATGWPCILSPWGAHHDAVLINTWLTPEFSYSANAARRAREARRMARAFAEFLRSDHRASAGAGRPRVLRTPVPVRSAEFEKLISKSLKRYPRIREFAAVGFREYQKSIEGRRLFFRYNEIFGKGNDT